MRTTVSIVLLAVVILGFGLSLLDVPFAERKSQIGDYYIVNGRDQTGATNIVTSVVLDYRGFDTLGEITVLFVAALGLGAVMAAAGGRRERPSTTEPPSLVLRTGTNVLFPLLILFGVYIFVHGHLTPGGGFQGGAIIASAFLLVYLCCRERRINLARKTAADSLGGIVFVGLGLVGLAVGSRYFLSDFLPKGSLDTLFSAGMIPIIYIAIGIKVGAELAGVIDDLLEETE